MRKIRSIESYQPKYKNLPRPWNLRYSRAKAQAAYFKQEWAFTADNWYKVWEDCGVKEHMGRNTHQYCMVRIDNIEAWAPYNVIIIPRRMHFKKLFYEYVANYPKTEYDPIKHAYYCPPEALEKYNAQ